MKKICGGKNKAVNREQSYEYLKKADGKGCGLHYILKKNAAIIIINVFIT